MRNLSPFTQSFDQLPNKLPIFPLSGAVLMPGGNLPLNIFEPRYLNMVHDAMQGDRLIGMIQPTDEEPVPGLHQTGCAGRVIRYEETQDGRLVIVLSGLCRFSIKEELPTIRGYRLVIPDWSAFEIDYETNEKPDTQSIMLFRAALRSYFTRYNLDTDWSVLENLEIEDLINSLISNLPVSIDDKQILLETDSLATRITAFTAILQGEDEATTQH